MDFLNKLEKYYQNGLLLKQTHPRYDLTIWNYTPKVQYERLWDDITLQCRGLVTNSEGKIIARPFKKFFNYEDQAIKGKEILERHDISAWRKDNTYLFEIIYPENRIVVDYGDEEKLVVIGGIHTETSEEIPDSSLFWTQDSGFEVVTTYKTWGEGYDLLKEEISKDKEGYVIRFKNGFRMKIKGEEYVRLHRILTNISNRDIWEYLKENKSFNDIIDKVPDEFYEWVKNTADSMVKQYESIEKKSLIDFANIQKNTNIEDRKSFALEALKCDNPSILFSMLDKKYYGDIIWKIIYPTYSKPFKNDEN